MLRSAMVMPMLHSLFCTKFLLLLMAGIVFPSLVGAHDVPNKISMEAFAKQQGNELHLVVRVPLVMLLNLDLPKRGTGFLDLEELEEPMKRAAAAVAQSLQLQETGVPLEFESATTRISRLSDNSFSEFETAVATVNGPPLAADTDVFWNQGFFDAHFIYSGISDQSDLSISLVVPPGLRNILSLNLVLLTEDGGSRAFYLDYNTGAVHLDPDWWRAAWDFGAHGFWHIFDGIDHLLFLLCLIVPFRSSQLWHVLVIVTSFTIAHSVTLTVAASGLAPQSSWFPPFVELAIAVSIIYMAIENFFDVDPQWRWIAAGLFGLLHGFGFSFALQDTLQFSGSHFILALLSYNIGIEIAQAVFVLVFIGVLGILPGSQSKARQITIFVSLLAGHAALHWAEERFDALSSTGALDLPWLGGAAVLWIIGLITAAIVALWIKRRALANGRPAPD